jgi:hypothetical protein
MTADYSPREKNKERELYNRDWFAFFGGDSVDSSHPDAAQSSP